MLAQAFHELYAERKAMLVNQPPQQQQQPQPPPTGVAVSQDDSLC
jgi:hypothetical protein